MQENFDNLIQKIQTELPDLITNEMLLGLGLASHVQLFRIRQRGELPFIKLSNARVLYLKNDVIAWLRKNYNDAEKHCLHRR